MDPLQKLGSHLAWLETESLHVIREVAGSSERPVLLFSGGKDSLVLLRLCEKAFWPAPVPFPLLHVDTGHNFTEVLAVRDARVQELSAQLIVASVEAAIASGRVEEEPGPHATRNRLQIPVLLEALRTHRFDAAFGGARRDEERARAKERVVSHRDEFGVWDPKNQRPELWNLYNLGCQPRENLRVFPLSNWTELDIWLYIRREKLALPSIYYSHRRRVVERDGLLLAVSEHLALEPHEQPFEADVRFRTVGDVTCTGAVRSNAADVDEVLAELFSSRVTERGVGRADDRLSPAAMERRKREGYF
jgi:sulfate adenylyltransferase subunit 2